jgi:hypothetical protein
MHKRHLPAFSLFAINFASANFASALAMPVNGHDQQVVEQSGQIAPGFFSKYVDCGGIAVRSSSAVEDEALHLGCEKISLMLMNIPRVREALMRQGAELHIIGRNE